MKLKSITVGNFKNVAETKLCLDTITAVISANNYGKSNLLEAVRFGFDFIAASPKVRSAMMGWAQAIPLSPPLAGKDYVFAVEFDDPDLGEYRFVRYQFRFSWLTDENEGFISDETIEIRPGEGVRYTSYLKRNNGKYRGSKANPNFRRISLPSNVLAVDALEAADHLDISGVIAEIKNLSCKICIPSGSDPSHQLLPGRFALSSSISFNDQEILKILSTLKRQYPQKYDLLLETIYDLFPEFKNINLQAFTLEENGSPVYQPVADSSATGKSSNNKKKKRDPAVPYHIQDEWVRLVIDSDRFNQPVSLEYLSAGARRMIWLTAIAACSGCDDINLIGIDEFETGIHPKMFRALLESLNDLLDDNAMIVTSHSPYLIQYLKPGALYIGVPDENGAAAFKRIRRAKASQILRTSRKLGMTVGEYLFDLLAGGQDSVSILTAYLED